jgi:hypothetical protein
MTAISAALPRLATLARTGDTSQDAAPATGTGPFSYHPGVLGWAGIGAGTALGGLVGLVGGGLLGLAAAPDGQKIGTVVMVGTALAGVLGGAYGAYALERNHAN